MRAIYLDHAQAVAQWDEAVSRVGTQTDSYSGQTLTPLYGGGVKAGEVDEAMPIRASAIRGHLRYWWRLLNGKDKDPKQLFTEEVAIWGGIRASMPVASRVSVRVSLLNKPVLKPAFTYHKRPDGRYRGMPDAALGVNAYALFPAQGTLKEGQTQIDTMPHEIAQEGIKFSLTITMSEQLSSEQQQQVRESLRWWASFGGVGARTRRGLGAVKIDGIAPVEPAEVAAVGGKLVLGQRDNAMICWNRAVGALQSFRQGVGMGRNPGSEPNRPGRSRWPEPDGLRTLTHRYDPKHQPEHPAEGLYPRAAFGLPIVFHFQSSRDPEGNLEPEGDAERMASPLILRPYWDGQHYSAAALLLPGWERRLSQPLKLRGRSEILTTWPKEASKRHEKAALIPPMVGRGDDPLTAFMNFFANGGA